MKRGKRLWCEDDATTNIEGHVTLAEAYLQIFNRPFFMGDAVEIVDAGDAMFYRFAEGHVVCASYPGNSAIYGPYDAAKEVLEELVSKRNWLVWSNEHTAWWGPNRRSYYIEIESAGRYTLEEALDICHNGRSRREDGVKDEVVQPSPEWLESRLKAIEVLK